MIPKTNHLIHGRETYAVYYGQDFVLKRPLPTFSDAARSAWLVKQHKTKDAIDAIRQVGNPSYNVPNMHFINDEEFQILEERAPGMPLTREYYRTLSRRQQFEIIGSLGAFLVDMNELKPVKEPELHKIADELKFQRLDNFICNKMSRWFSKNEIKQMSRLRDEIGAFEYITRPAWSHFDINSGNVFYDRTTSKLSFIDFAEADYHFIYHDIFAPLQIELDIHKQVYEVYSKLHNSSKYSIPSIKNENLRKIMKYRIMLTYLKRFIKASDDLRINPKHIKSEKNNDSKVAFMREQMQNIHDLESRFSRNR